jgi:hypothetical protein
MRYAVVNKNNNNKVENVIVWDGTTNLYNQDTYILIQLNENEECAYDYVYDETENPRFFAENFYDLQL